MVPTIRIDYLFEQSMQLVLDEFYIRHVTSFKFHQFKNMLCLDVFTEIQEYQLLILNNLRIIECYKTLVDCIFDFGQFAAKDTQDSEKSISPFTKLIDQC